MGPPEARAGERFPRSLRLRSSADFQQVHRHGRRLEVPHLVVRYLARGDRAGPRFGLAVSRKVGNAVVRNRVKRWLRESIRRQWGSRAADLAGHDVVFIARSSAAEAGYEAIRHGVSTALGAVADAGRSR